VYFTPGAKLPECVKDFYGLPLHPPRSFLGPAPPTEMHPIIRERGFAFDRSQKYTYYRQAR
jgi:hypothetical protein